MIRVLLYTCGGGKGVCHFLMISQLHTYLAIHICLGSSRRYRSYMLIDYRWFRLARHPFRGQRAKVNRSRDTQTVQTSPSSTAFGTFLVEDYLRRYDQLLRVFLTFDFVIRIRPACDIRSRTLARANRVHTGVVACRLHGGCFIPPWDGFTG